jgi:hypothetical protein
MLPLLRGAEIVVGHSPRDELESADTGSRDAVPTRRSAGRESRWGWRREAGRRNCVREARPEARAPTAHTGNLSSLGRLTRPTTPDCPSQSPTTTTASPDSKNSTPPTPG